MTKIEFVRRQAGLSQQQLAKMVGVTTGAVSTWENQRHEPAANKLFQLSKALHVPMEQLVGTIDARVGVVLGGDENDNPTNPS